MFFKRSNGEFRETDRVTRFKLIKSGKNWLRAATSNFGLLKVIRGQVEKTVVAEVREDEVSATEMTSRGLLKGIGLFVNCSGLMKSYNLERTKLVLSFLMFKAMKILVLKFSKFRKPKAFRLMTLMRLLVASSFAFE